MQFSHPSLSSWLMPLIQILLALNGPVLNLAALKIESESENKNSQSLNMCPVPTEVNYVNRCVFDLSEKMNERGKKLKKTDELNK